MTMKIAFQKTTNPKLRQRRQQQKQQQQGRVTTKAQQKAPTKIEQPKVY